jgi:hypothetical protein
MMVAVDPGASVGTARVDLDEVAYPPISIGTDLRGPTLTFEQRTAIGAEPPVIRGLSYLKREVYRIYGKILVFSHPTVG